MKQQTRTLAELKREIESTMSEEQLLARVIEIAHEHGWIVSHFRPSLSQSGRWHTAVQGDGAGWPDLVLCRPSRRIGKMGRLLFVELKSARGKLSEAQKAWIAALRDSGEIVHVWRPTDWEEIERTLRGEEEGEG